MWYKINKRKAEIWTVLNKNETKICFQGEDYNTSKLFEGYYSEQELNDCDLKEHDRPFNDYLECQLGYLTADQMRKLEDLHRSLNEELQEVYGALEYNMAKGG